MLHSEVRFRKMDFMFQVYQFSKSFRYERRRRIADLYPPVSNAVDRSYYSGVDTAHIWWNGGRI